MADIIAWMILIFQIAVVFMLGFQAGVEHRLRQEEKELDKILETMAQMREKDNDD